MRTLFFTLILLAFVAFQFSSCSKQCDCKLLAYHKDNNLYYNRETNTAYSGTCKEVYGDGKDKVLSKFKDGKIIKSEGWWENGQAWYVDEYDLAGVFKSEKNYFKSGKLGFELSYDPMNKELFRKFYFEDDGQLRFLETIKGDTLTYKSFRPGNKINFEKQTIVYIDWNSYLKPGIRLSAEDNTLTDNPENPLNGYLISYKSYYDNDTPEIDFKFKDVVASPNFIPFLEQAPHGYPLYQKELRNNIPILCRDLRNNTNFLKPGSKVYYPDNKVMFEIIEPIVCEESSNSYSSPENIIGVFYNENGNIFELVSCYSASKDPNSGTRFNQIFEFKDGNWELPEMYALNKWTSHLKGKSISDITSPSQLCPPIENRKVSDEDVDEIKYDNH